MKLLLLIALTAGVLCRFSSAAPLREVEALAKPFRAAEVTGTFVMLDPEADELLVHNAARANQRFAPASTFKLANALIGLDCGAISSVDEVLPYGGKPQPIKSWEKDMSVRDGLPISNVPVFQELARRIGLERMGAGLKKLEYGNQAIGNVVDRFWLDGPLEISAVEQVRFLSRLGRKDLPVSETALDAVHEISLQEKSATHELHGKTGWRTGVTPAIGWYVGWVNRAGRVYPFALNMDMPRQEDAAERVEIAKACLRALGKLD